MPYDLIIKNGSVIDGQGNPVPFAPWHQADVAIKGGKIVRVEKIDAGGIEVRDAKEIIDASGLMVAPGIIDIHSHSDAYLLENPRAESTIRQGITTVVMGNCGMSAAPIGGDYRPSKSIMPDKLVWDWVTMDDYLNQLAHKGVSVNVVPLVGHSNIRGTVMGYRGGKPSNQEMDQMKQVLRDALDAGVWGMSTGLIYPPGSFADEQELTDLLKIVAPTGGVHHTHIRGQGETLIAAVQEVLAVTLDSAVPLHILHHKGMGDENGPKVMQTLGLIEETISRGVDVTLDMYPYRAGQGGLGLFLPLWVHEGGPGRLTERLKDSNVRARIIHEMLEPGLAPGYQSYVKELGREKCWDHVLICECTQEKNKYLAGKSIARAKPKWQDPFSFIFDLLIEEGGDVPVVIPDAIDLDDTYLQMVLRHPLTMFGSDGYALAPYGILGEGVPHPRSYGTFPKVLGRYVRERRLFTWQEAFRKMTSLPAGFLGIKDRGEIREGVWGDIMIFDPKRIIDKASFSDPHQYPEGIAYVICNGVVVVKHNEHTGAMPGKVLRRR